MKKIKTILIILTLSVSIIGMFLGTKILNGKKNDEVYVKGYDYLYDIAISYLKNQEDKESNQNGYKFFIAYDGFGITEKDDKKYVYMWVLGENYYLEENEIKNGSGYSIFHKFTFKDDKVINVEITKDGSLYTDSVKEMCPTKQMEKKVLKYNSKLSVKNEVISYYSNLKYSFKAKIVESYDQNIIVETLDDSTYFKKGNKVNVQINRPTNGINDYYVIGNTLEITFDGIVNEIYPPQIKAISTSLIS